MTRGELSTDLENLKADYILKISTMQQNFRSGKYRNSRCYQRMVETLASYMASYDELEQLIDIKYEAQQRGWFKQSKHGEYKEKIKKEF